MTGPSAKRDQQERRAIIKAEREPTTFHALANLDTSLGGRFAAGGDVSGSAPTVDYPKLPASSPWAGNADPGIEPPTGTAIDEHEAVGTAAEIERSLVLAAAIPGEKQAEVAPTLAASSPASVVETPRPVPSAEERLAEILPRLARPTIRKRKV